MGLGAIIHVCEPIVKVKNLIKKYKKGTVNAVDDISFEVAEGSFFALLGPNGAGKTTTLSKTSGEVYVAGYNLDKNSSEVRRNIGVIFQNPSLDANLTAEENIRFHANLYGLYSYAPAFRMMPESYRKKVEQLAKVIGLKMDELFNPIKSYSGGMKRKLEIIRGLMHDPKVLFLDEPTIGLDPVSRKNLWTYLQEVRRKENITIFLTTHYLDEAEGADHICIINHGKIISEGSPQQIKEKLIDEHLIVDSGNRSDLIRELSGRNIKFTGDGPYKIDIKQSREVQDLMKKIETPLTKVNVYAPSLEEAYINLIENGQHETEK